MVSAANRIGVVTRPDDSDPGSARASMGRLLRWAIFASWLMLIGLLLRQQWSGPPRPEPLPDLGSAQTPASEEWMGMYHGGQKIGYVHSSVFPDADGYATEEESLLRITVLDSPQTVRMRVKGRSASDHSLERLSFELDNGQSRFRAEGERRGSVFHLRTVVGEQESEAELPMDGPFFLPASVRRHLAAGELTPGKRYEVRVFDPSMMKAQGIVATVVREEEVPQGGGVRAWRIEEEYAGVKSAAWLDREGRVLREEGPMGLVLVRESPEDATRRNWAEGAALDLVASVSIPVDPPLAAPQALRGLDLEVGGVELERIPGDGRQQLRGAVLTIEKEAIPPSAGYALPYGGDEWRSELSSTVLLQSDHPRIREVARQALGEETDPIEAARRLERFVYERLRKVPTMSVPNALQVLDMGEGDCNEHAVLFAALARAAGLPARVVAGVVYANGAFQYHAWDEVWVGRWVSVDAAFHQFPADPTHVKFVAGGPEDHIAMVAVIGRLRLKVVEARGG
jgi:hypothetical protein